MGCCCSKERPNDTCGKWLFRKLMLKCFIRLPARPFEDSEPPPAPDYQDAANWAALPGKPSPADALPGGGTVSAEELAARPAACFFLHHTTYFGNTWNCPIPHAQADAFVDTQMHLDASAFNSACAVYAPRYRQCTLASFLIGPRGRAPMALAYSDVRRAFERFLQLEPTRPFILAGHSQGGGHTERLLQEMIAPNENLRKRLVCAYAVGCCLTLDSFERNFPLLHPCNGPTDTGCVIAYMTHNESSARKRIGHPDASGDSIGHRFADDVWEPMKYPRLNTNPLTWRSNVEYQPQGAAANPLLASPLLASSDAANEGEWLGSSIDPNAPDIASGEFMKGTVPEATIRTMLNPLPASGIMLGDGEQAKAMWARSQEHALIVPTLNDRQRGHFRGMTKNGDYHLLDFRLFYYNIRRNCEERVAAYMAQK